jgi:hypothetical protein
MTLDGNKKPTVRGVKAFIDYIRQALQQEAPIRVTGTFELVFYDRSVRRTSTESIAAYIVMRHREFDKLK